MAKRAAMTLGAIPAAAAGKRSSPASEKPEYAALNARLPWETMERLRNLARDRSHHSGRRVTITELLVEAIGRLE